MCPNRTRPSVLIYVRIVAAACRTRWFRGSRTSAAERIECVRRRGHVPVGDVRRATAGAGPDAGVRVPEAQAHTAFGRVPDVLRRHRRPGMAGQRGSRDGHGHRTVRSKGPHVAELQGAGVRVCQQSGVHR